MLLPSAEQWLEPILRCSPLLHGQPRMGSGQPRRAVAAQGSLCCCRVAPSLQHTTAPFLIPRRWLWLFCPSLPSPESRRVASGGPRPWMLLIFPRLSPSRCDIPGGFTGRSGMSPAAARAHLNKPGIDGSAALSHTQTGRAAVPSPAPRGEGITGCEWQHQSAVLLSCPGAVWGGGGSWGSNRGLCAVRPVPCDCGHPHAAVTAAVRLPAEYPRGPLPTLWNEPAELPSGSGPFDAATTTARLSDGTAFAPYTSELEPEDTTHLHRLDAGDGTGLPFGQCSPCVCSFWARHLPGGGWRCLVPSATLPARGHLPAPGPGAAATASSCPGSALGTTASTRSQAGACLELCYWKQGVSNSTGT